MEGLHCLQYTVAKGDWMAKIDLKDAYLAVSILEDSRKFFQFIWKYNVYEYIAMPFGLNMKVAIPVAPLFYRDLQFDLISALHKSNSYNQNVVLSQPFLGNIAWWITDVTNWNSNPIMKPEISLVIQTDASLTGWGAYCLRRGLQGHGIPRRRAATSIY
ncbi:hypothetical protein LOD99_13828 [Oopsacas minuta]|uniref:Reverse transcriptase domain-containing protein n=1 Tax=Oopsacas minuta TaxID=111878 RepID=A0AAV7KND8_9METZ|nr:hypothetical protein LOD99_13828 [Oopsacas minuta]